MDHPAPSSDTLFRARRKLVRGTFAVPAALAVHNGSALAAASNNRRCAINSITDPTRTPPAGVVGTTHDGRWTRVKVYQEAGTGYYWVSKTELNDFATAKNLGFLGPSGSGTHIRSYTNGTYSYTLGSPSGGLSLAGYVAVLFDNAGTAPNTVRVVGFVKWGATSFSGATGAVTGSCWSSLTV